MSKKNSPSHTIGPKGASFLATLNQAHKTYFTTQEASKICGKDTSEVRSVTKRLVNAGLLARIKPGLFAILPAYDSVNVLSSWPLIARELYHAHQYFLSHYSAMRLHGMTTHPLNIVYITLNKRQRKHKFQGICYQPLYSTATNFWGIEAIWVNKFEKVLISNIERTLLDAFARPELCGGIEEVVRGLWVKQNEINFGKLIGFAERFHQKAAVKRLGFVLEILELDNLHKNKLLQLVKDDRSFVLLNPSGNNVGKYLTKWHLRVNIDVNQIKESIWR